MLQQENWFDANTSAEEKGHHDLWTSKREKIDDKQETHTKNGKQKQNKSSWATPKKHN